MNTNDAEIVHEQPQLAVGPYQPENATPSGTTSTQSRVEAVAELTKTAMARAGTLQLTPEESKALLADFSDSDFQPGAAGKEHLLYIEHSALRNRLNTVLGLGQWAVIVRETWNEDFTTQKEVKGVRVYSRAMLLVRGCYVGEAVGDMDYYPGNAAQNYGDAFEGAKTAAFRRCAKEFGIGLQAWRKDFAEGWKARKYDRLEQAQAQKFPPKAAAVPDPRPLKERLAALAIWLQGQLGVDDYKCVVPYLRSFTVGGSDKSAALMPMEELSDLNEFSLAAIKAAPMGFIERIKSYAKANDQIPGAEADITQVIPRSAIDAAVKGSKIEVPRDADAGKKDTESWWKEAEIHFGKNKGTKLGELDTKTLFGWWANWQPKPSPTDDEISGADEELRQALDACGEHYNFVKKD